MMELLGQMEDLYEAELIDEFDGSPPTAPVPSQPLPVASVQRAALVNRSTPIRYPVMNFPSPLPQHAPIAAHAYASTDRHISPKYPSMDALITLAETNVPNNNSENRLLLHSLNNAATVQPTPVAQCLEENGNISKEHQQPIPPPEATAPDKQSDQPYLSALPADEEVVLTDKEFEANRQIVENEMVDYQLRLNYVAKALAGETLHQIEERKRREMGRAEREQHRLLAMEARIQHQIELAHEREQRREKIVSRTRRSSQSPVSELTDNYENNEEAGKDKETSNSR